MYKIDRVGKVEILKSLKNTMKQNTDALDYIENLIYQVQNELGYSPEDKNLQEDLESLKYIRFSLYYLDDMYMKAFNKHGGKL